MGIGKRTCPFCGGEHYREIYGKFCTGFCCLSHAWGESLSDYMQSLKNVGEKIQPKPRKSLKTEDRGLRFHADPLALVRRVVITKGISKYEIAEKVKMPSARLHDLLRSKGILRYNEGISLVAVCKGYLEEE